MKTGVINYNDEGLPRCEECGRYFRRILAHARQAHDMTALEYKKKYSLDTKKGICSKESAEATRSKTVLNYDKVVKKNLIEGGKKSQFEKGHKGRTKDKVSDQTRLRLLNLMREPKMHEARVRNGRKIGLSGLGNAKRWGKKLKDI